MKKTVSLIVTALLAVQCLMAQVAEGIKFLNYEKYKSARETLKKAYDANPKDPLVFGIVSGIGGERQYSVHIYIFCYCFVYTFDCLYQFHESIHCQIGK